jgi:RNA polymerase sigma-70 factor (ECF subfamily)
MEAVIWERIKYRSYSRRFCKGEGIEGRTSPRPSFFCVPGISSRAATLFSPGAEMSPASDASDDAAIIHDILKGNVNSFELLLDRYQDHVSKIVRSNVPWDDAPEVAHETFVRAFQSLGGYRGIRPFKHWLAKIAVRCCHDFWRSYYQKERQVGGLSDDCRAWVDEVLADRSPEEATERMEARDLLQWALGQLSPDDRMVLTLTYLNEYSGTEAAELLGWSLPRVKIQSYRARRKLRAILTKILPQ